LDFQLGSKYTRAEIREVFGGQRQGGICTPRNYPVVILFTSQEGSKYGYRDEWKDDGFFHYTGEGRYGPMHMTKGNRAIREHVENRKSLMLFKELRKSLHEFLGYMEYSGHYTEDILDRKGGVRSGVIFKLMPVIGPPSDDEHVTSPHEQSLEVLRARALEASSQVVERATRLSTHRERSRAVAQYVLGRARGFCEGCGVPAPFARKDGSAPYLETHHIHRVSDEGPDAPSEVIALCPTCHRLVHYGEGGETYNRLELAGIPLAYEAAYAEGRLKVVAAAIILDATGRVLVCQRSRGTLAGYWEFPGGKVRKGESPEDCIKREIQEELRLALDSVMPFMKVDHDYPDVRIRLLCFACTAAGAPAFVEHSAGRWVRPEELAGMNLAAADSRVARRLLPARRVMGLPLAADRGRTEYRSNRP
jgi:5-methylcytosine-specific restriction protein A